jgi:hypothetical protein
MGDLVAVSAPTNDGKHAIPLRLRQLGGIVFTVLHPGAARQHTEKLPTRAFRRCALDVSLELWVGLQFDKFLEV